MDPIDHQIGARIRALRERRGVTQVGLAEAVGIDVLELDHYETGAVAAPASLIVRLAAAMDASASELIAGRTADWREALDDLARAGADGTTELVSAFFSIPDDRVRRAFLDLAWTIVGAQAPPESER